MSLNMGKNIIYESSDTDEEIRERQKRSDEKDYDYVLEIELDDEELMNVENDISTSALETLGSAAASKKTGSSSTGGAIVMANTSKMKSNNSQANGISSSANVSEVSASKTSSKSTSTATTASSISSSKETTNRRLNPLFEKFLCVITTDKDMQEKMRRDFHEERFVKVREKYISVRGPRRGRWGEAEHKVMSKYLDMIENHDLMPLVSLEGPYAQHEVNEEAGEIKHKTNPRLLRHFLAIMLARSIETFNQEWNRQKDKNKQTAQSKFVENGMNLQSMMEGRKLTEFWNSYPSNTPKQESNEKMVLGAMEKLKDLMTKYQERHRDMIQHLKNHKATNDTSIPPLESSAPSFEDISEQAREILSQLQTLEKDYQIDLHNLLWKSIAPES